MDTQPQPPIQYSLAEIERFCKRWQVTEFAFFGSVLRSDFQGESDVDVLVSFAPGAPWSLFELIRMEDELSEIFGRKVDLVEREGLRNPYRRKHILSNREVIYEAG